MADESVVYISDTDLGYYHEKVKSTFEKAADASKVKTVAVNGTALTPDINGQVDVSVPTDTVTTAQLAAKQDALSTEQQAAVDSGITAAKVKSYDGLVSTGGQANTIETVKVNGTALTPDSNKAVDITVPTVNDSTVTVTAYDGTTTTFTANQAKAATVGKGMSDAEKAAIASGITSAKVTTYDGYATTLAGKQDTLTDAQKAAANSGITADKVTAYDAKPTTEEMNSAIAAAKTGAAMFQGTVAAESGISNGYKKGYYWVVGTAGTYVGETCEVGDFIYAVKDATSSTALTNGDFSIVQANISDPSAFVKSTDMRAMTTAEIDKLFA